MTPLLVAAVVFLAFNLFFQRGTEEQKPVADIQKSYDDAVVADDNLKIMEFGRLYASKLEEKEDGKSPEVEQNEEKYCFEKNCDKAGFVLFHKPPYAQPNPEGMI